MGTHCRRRRSTDRTRRPDLDDRAIASPRLAHAAVSADRACRSASARQRVVIEQRHRHRRQLLRATVRIAIKRIQQRRRIDARQVGERDQRLRARLEAANASDGARHEASEACGSVRVIVIGKNGARDWMS